MKRIIGLSIFVAVAVAASVDACQVETSGPCAPTSEQKAIALQQLIDVNTKEAAMLQARAAWNDAERHRPPDPEAELIVYENYVRAQFDFQAAEAFALSTIRDVYHVDPTVTSGLMHAPIGANTGLDWVANKQIEWRPIVENRYVPEEVAGPDRAHYCVSAGPDAGGSTSLCSGRVIIDFEMISNAIASKNPGIVAAILYHEGVHFQQMISRGSVSREQDEYEAYDAESKHLDAFDLPQEQIDLILAERQRNKDALDSGFATGFKDSPEQEASAQSLFLADKSNEADLATYYSNLRAAVLQIRNERERLREEERRRQVEERNQFLARVGADIRRCGFEPIYKSDGQDISGFKTKVRGWPVSFIIAHRMTEGEFTTALMFSRLCMDVTMEDVAPDQAAPCNSGAAIADQNWDDAGFRDDAILDATPDEQSRCQRYLHDHWKKNLDGRARGKVLSKALGEYQRGVDDAWRREERDRRDREDQSRETRRSREPSDSSGPGGGSGYDHPHAPLNCGFNSNGAYCY